MHHANHFYGHAHIMARYVGLEEPLRIWGYLQHGWNMHDGFAVGTVFAPRYPKLVWSQACARRGWAAGLRDYRLVAAPWLYLLRLEQQEQWLAQPGNSAQEREGTIVYPFHGWEGQQVVGNHAAYIDEIKSTEGDVPITVCLHWNEFDNPKVRSEYEDAGVRVITHGERGFLWKDTDVAFLYRQLDEMRRHKRVVSNRMSSAVLYAAAAGIEAGVYGDPMALEADHAILGGVGKPRRMWPEMHQVSIPMDYASRSPTRSSAPGRCCSPKRSSRRSAGPRPWVRDPARRRPARPWTFPAGFSGPQPQGAANSHTGPAGAEQAWSRRSGSMTVRPRSSTPTSRPRPPTPRAPRPATGAADSDQDGCGRCLLGQVADGRSAIVRRARGPESDPGPGRSARAEATAARCTRRSGSGARDLPVSVRRGPSPSACPWRRPRGRRGPSSRVEVVGCQATGRPDRADVGGVTGSPARTSSTTNSERRKRRPSRSAARAPDARLAEGLPGDLGLAAQGARARPARARRRSRRLRPRATS